MCRILLLKMVHVQFNFDSLFTLKNDYKCIKRKYPDFTKMFLYTFTKKMECGNVVPLLWLSLVTCKFLLWTCEHLFESEPVAAPPNRVGWWPRVDCLPPPPPKKKKIYHQPPPVLTISLQQVYVNAKRTKQLLEQPQKKTEATQTPYSF